MTGDARRVVVTGLGPVTCIGVGADAFHRGQLAGASGVRRISRFDATGLPVGIAGEVDLPDGYAPSRRDLATTDRNAQLARVAARLAIEHSGLSAVEWQPERIGVVVGTGIGGAETMQEMVRTVYSLPEPGAGRALPGARAVPKAMGNSAAALISIEHGLSGPTSTAVSACASGADALVAAYQMIACGEADVVLAGGTEAPLVEPIVGGFARMGALSRWDGEPSGASRPFHADRDGFVLAEGAAMLVLESAGHAAARGAPILAELAGYGRASDAFHVTMPHPDGDGARRALQAALRHAGVAPAEVSYINAHGTGTAFNDAGEVRAIRAALGDAAEKVPVSSTKSQTGHTLGAAGAIEAVACVQAIINATAPPTINLDRPDPLFGLDFVGSAPRPAAIEVALSDSFAFGGHNVVLVFRKV